ncbi:MAG: hypothetical protein Q9174_002693 [Haloplaca sp. 1 TL-2023]
MAEKDKNGGEDDRLSAQGHPHDDHAVEKRDNTAVYTVYPKNLEANDQAAAIDSLLKGLVDDQSEIRTTEMDGHTVFWTAPLTSDAAEIVEQDPNVRPDDQPRALEDILTLHQVGSAPRECVDDCDDHNRASIDEQRPAEHTDNLIKRDDRVGYIIYQKDSTNFGQAAAIHTLLRTLVTNTSEIYVSDTSQRTSFFGARLTTEGARKVKADPNVAAVAERCTSNCYDPTQEAESTSSSFGEALSPFHGTPRHVKRDDGNVNSHRADPEMVYLSLPEGRKVTDFEDFVYDNSAGEGVTIYIVDTGAGLSNDQEFAKFVRSNVRWLHAKSEINPDANTNEDDIYGAGHGTGLLARAAGWLHGPAKRSSPVVVRIPNLDLGEPATWLDGIRQVAKDWEPIYKKNPKTATAIMNLSWGFPDEKLDVNQRQQWKNELRDRLNDCVRMGILPVVGSGNSPRDEPPNQPVNQYPALFAYGLSPAVPGMMIVGGVRTDGSRWRGSRRDPEEILDVNRPGHRLPRPDARVPVIKVHAPSVDLQVPDARTGGWRGPVADGTSYAAPAVAGLGAYFLGLSSQSEALRDDDPFQRVSKLKKMLEISTPIERVPGIGSLYNLKDPRACPPDVPLPEPPPGLNPSSLGGEEVGCRDTGTSTSNTVVAIPSCFITTMDPTPTRGLTAATPLCSCADGALAGVGVGAVDGTTYTWCQTGGDLPSGVPPAAATQRVAPETPSTTPVPISTEYVWECDGTTRPTSAATA